MVVFSKKIKLDWRFRDYSITDLIPETWETRNMNQDLWVKKWNPKNGKYFEFKTTHETFQDQVCFVGVQISKFDLIYLYTKIKEDNVVKCDLFDFAMVKDISMSELRKANASMCQYPVLAVKCCLESWVGKDEKEAQAEFGDIMKKLMMEYGEIEAEVLEKCDNYMKVKIESVESKLVKQEETPSMSRAALLKMKLKNVK